jgi:tetratricopeptide (TPR) repeat protein
MTGSAPAGRRSRSTVPTATTKSPAMIRNEQLKELVSQLSNGGRFTAHLYGWGALAITALGALFATLSNDAQSQILASAGLVAASGIVRCARRAAHYTAMAYPIIPSMIAGLLLGGFYTAGEAGALWLQQNRHLDDPVGIGINSLIAIMTLTLVTRYGTRLRVPTGDYLPDGMPVEVSQEIDSLTEPTKRPESPKPTTSSWRKPENRVAAEREAVRLLQILTNARRSIYEPRLALSLHELGWTLGDIGRAQEAITPLEQAIQIRRRLAKANPPTYEPSLASSLHELGWALSQAGRQADARQRLRQAAQIRRRLAKANPAAYEPSLATSLHELGCVLGKSGRAEEATASLEQAIQVWRRLAKASPAVYEPRLAASLHELGAELSEVGWWLDARQRLRQAAQIWRRLAKASPAAYEPCLATSLHQLGFALGKSERTPEATASLDQAIQIWRRLAKANPATYEPSLGTSLDELGWLLGEMQSWHDALEPLRQAAEIRRRLAKANPAVYEPVLSSTLKLLEVAQSRDGRQAYPLESLLQAAGISPVFTPIP